MIVTDKKKLTKVCKSVDVKEGVKLGKKLLSELNKTNNGVGLAANQIGINKSVCVINVTEPIILVNPRIIGKFGKIYFKEACLSFPGDYVYTERWSNVMVEADNHKNNLIFDEKNILECVCVQHEIDHLNGITMFERAVHKNVNKEKNIVIQEQQTKNKML